MKRSPALGALKESDIQIQVADWLRANAARCDFFFFAIPNEGIDRASPARLAKLERMGLLPGAADLVIIKAGKVFFLEMKRPSGKQSDQQRDFERAAITHGANYAIAYSFDQASEILRNWRIIT